MSLAPGARLGPYEVIVAVGAGGMGEVYRARDTRLNRDVAIKILPDPLAAAPDRLARFQREAQVLAALNHPNIAHIHGLEEIAGGKALVLELVDGPTLADLIARGPIPIDEALPIAHQIAEALEAAHEQGIVHRDLKPANIKITPDGKVKVLDFGLAKMMETETSGVALSMSPTLSLQGTHAGVILGTAAYMSPEQARGKPVDRRTDIWSFGCVLFEMLAGRTTFDAGDTVSDAVASILKNDPDWSALPANTPAHVRALLRRCLRKDVQKRLPHIGVARLEIEEGPSESVDAKTQDAPPARQPLWRRAMPSALTAIIAGATVAGIAYYTRPSPTPPGVTHLSFPLGDGQAFTNLSRQLVAISPDGTQMAYVANQRLWLRSMSDPNARPIPGTEIHQSVGNPIFSPDGRSLAFWSAADSTLKRIAISGGAPVTICPANNPNGMSWGTDGLIFGQGAGGIMRVSPNGGKPELLSGVKSGELAEGPQMLPGGELLLFTLATGTSTDRWDKAQIVVQSLTSGERKTLIQNGSGARYLPTGHLVYALGGVLYAVPFDLTRLQVTAGPVPILEGLRRANAPAFTTGVAHFSVSGTGSLMFVPGPISAVGQMELALFDVRGGTEPLKLPPGSYTNPRISPDGKYVAFGNDDGTEASVWIYELSGGSSMRRLTFEGQGHNRFPVWSADSQRVAFQSDREGDLGIFWQREDGTGTAERLTKADEGASHIPESWAPDGERLLYNAGKGGTTALWVFSLKDRKAARFDAVESPSPTLTGAVFSPDGRWVAYASREGRTSSAVYVQPFPPTGAKYQISKNADDGHHPVWSPDGAELWFTPGPVSQVNVVRVSTQPRFTFGEAVTMPRSFTNASPAYERPYDILPDGKRFISVFPSGEAASAAGTAQINVVLNWTEELKQRVPVK